MMNRVSRVSKRFPSIPSSGTNRSGERRAWPARRSRRCPARRGRVPSASPDPESPPSRDAQKASATYAGACRTSSEPCSTSAIDSTSRRADGLVGRRRAPWPAGRPRRPAGGPRRGASPTSARNASTARRLAGQRAQHVERVDVARALPDRVQRGLPVEPRQPALLDVPVAAQALQRLADDAGVRLQTQYLPTATASRRKAALVRASTACGQPQRQRGGRLGLHREVGQHVAHQRLVGQQRAERRPVPGVVDRLGDGAAHQRRPSRARSPAGSPTPSR